MSGHDEAINHLTSLRDIYRTKQRRLGMSVESISVLVDLEYELTGSIDLLKKANHESVVAAYHKDFGKAALENANASIRKNLFPKMDDAVVLPKELTAENGAKALLIGEFFEGVRCEYDNEDGPQEELFNVPVSWTTIKNIYKKIVKHFG